MRYTILILCCLFLSCANSFIYLSLPAEAPTYGITKKMIKRIEKIDKGNRVVYKVYYRKTREMRKEEEALKIH